MTIQFEISEYLYKCLKKRIELNMASELDMLVDKGTVIEQEPCENMERKIEKEYLFESLCEDLKKLQTENENLRNALEQEPKNKDLINHIEAVQEALNNMVDALNDDTDYYNATYHLEQIKKRWSNDNTYSH